MSIDFDEMNMDEVKLVNPLKWQGALTSSEITLLKSLNMFNK
jgi:hypothetical protein